MLAPGGWTIADNVIYPGAPDLLEYLGAFIPSAVGFSSASSSGSDAPQSAQEKSDQAGLEGNTVVRSADSLVTLFENSVASGGRYGAVVVPARYEYDQVSAVV